VKQWKKKKEQMAEGSLAAWGGAGVWEGEKKEETCRDGVGGSQTGAELWGCV